MGNPNNIDEAKAMHELNAERSRRDLIVSVYDHKQRAYSSPVVCKNAADGVRSFLHGRSDPQSMLSKFPEDYELHSLGEFDSETGRIFPISKPLRLASATDGRPSL